MELRLAKQSYVRLLSEQMAVKRDRDEVEDFSLVLGGPLYQLLLRFRLIEPLLAILDGESE